MSFLSDVSTGVQIAMKHVVGVAIDLMCHLVEELEKAVTVCFTEKNKEPHRRWGQCLGQCRCLCRCSRSWKSNHLVNQKTCAHSLPEILPEFSQGPHEQPESRDLKEEVCKISSLNLVALLVSSVIWNVPFSNKPHFAS